MNRPLSPIGSPSPRQKGGAAGPSAPTLSKMPCLSCDGKGEAEYMGLCEDRYHWRDCHVCDGTGLVAPYCETCEGALTADGFCYSCDDYGEGFEPVGWLRAETSAYGIGAK